MTSVIDPNTIGKPPKRRHVRTLTGKTVLAARILLSPDILSGYLPEVDETGKEKWPRGEEKAWKAGIRGPDRGK